MRYWDASALVPLVVSEANSELARGWLSHDSHIVTWAWSRVGIVGAVERHVREGLISRTHRREALERFLNFAETWDEVTDILAVRSRATALLARHPLRAADAGQLGAALLVNDSYPGTLSFVCTDLRLTTAAELESLRVIP